jgi:radical SAM protein with 4Fe4S-binding SPASM domain
MLPNLDQQLNDNIIPTLPEIRQSMMRFLSIPRKLQVYGYLIDSLQGITANRRCKNLERHYMYISYDGQCWWMAGLSGALLGNIHSENVTEISRRLGVFMEELTPPKRCETCPARFICAESPHLSNVLTN